MRRRVLAGMSLVSALAAAGACTSYTGDSSQSTAGDDASAGDVSVPDAAPPPSADGGDSNDAAVEAEAGAQNLLTNGDFELGCAGWTGNSSTSLVEDATSHTGTKSCRVCIANGGGGALIQTASLTLAAGAQLVMAAWVRAAPGAGTPTPSTALHLLSGGTIVQSTSETIAPVPSDTWEHVSSLITTTTSGDAISALVILAGTTGQCFLVDDATLYQLK